MTKAVKRKPGAAGHIPKDMLAMRLHRYGGPEVFEPEIVPVPAYGAREVLVRIRMLAVNGWDARVRQGRAPQLPGRRPIEFPIQPGREMIGDVVATGPEVHWLEVGDRVLLSSAPSCNDCEFCLSGRGNLCARVDYPGHARAGTYAQYAAFPETWLLKVPESLSDEEAVAIPWAYGNALHAVVAGEVSLGCTVAVTAASSAIGIACIQLAKLMGAKRVIALSRSPEKTTRLIAAGADDVVDYASDNGLARAQAVAGLLPFGGVDVVLDNYGGQQMMDLAIAIAGFQARIVMVAWQGEKWDGSVSIPGLVALGKELRILTSRGSLFLEQKLVVELAGARKIRMPVDAIFELEDVAEAHALLDSCKHVGKILLRA